MVRGSPRLVGRAPELEVLERVVRAWDHGSGGLVVLTGEAGIGKSALWLAALDPDRVAVGHLLPGPGAGWGPLPGLLADLVARGADPTAATMGPYAATLAGLLPTPTPDTTRTPRDPHPVVIADAALRLWATLPVPKRPRLVVEDVHWADPETWALLQRWAERAETETLPLLMTTRPEGAVWPAVRRLLDDGTGRVLHLAPLPESAVQLLVADRLGTSPEAVPDHVLVEVRAAEGRPLLIEELLAALTRQTEEPNAPGALSRPRAGGGRDGLGRAATGGMAELTRGRLATLSGPARALVERAAVAGPELDTRLLATSFEVADETFRSLVSEATSAGLLSVDPGGRVAFRHELLRDAVVIQLLDLERTHHADALLAALGVPSSSPYATWPTTQSLEAVVLAGRLTALAGRPGAAAVLHLEAARRHLARGTPVAAAAAAESALVADPSGTPEIPETPETLGIAGVSDLRVDALLCLVEALALGGEVDRALHAAGRLEAALAVRPGGDDLDRTRQDRSREAVARAHVNRGDWAGARHLLGVPRTDEPATTSSLRALVALHRGDYTNAETWARAVLEAGNHGPGACESIEVLGRLGRRHDLAEAEQWFSRGVELAESLGLDLWRARAAHELATVAQLRALAIAPLVDARAAAVTAGAPGLVTAVDFHLAATHGVRFEGEPALVASRRLLSDARRLGARRQEAWAWVLIGQAHAVSGSRDRAEAAGREAVDSAQGDPELLGMARTVCHGLPALLADDIEVALRDWAEGVRWMRQLSAVSPVPPWYLWPVLATVTDAEGDGGARARAETEHGDLRVFPGADGLWRLAAAVAAGRTGDRSAAGEHADAAEELLRKVPAFAGWAHLARRWVSEDAVLAGWGAPATWMIEAEPYFAKRGWHPLAATCRSLARRAGVTQRRRGRGNAEVPDHLRAVGVTSREVDVLLLVAQGLSNAQVAERLYLSPRTVKGYVEQLLAKTGAANRTQLATHLTGPPVRG